MKIRKIPEQHKVEIGNLSSAGEFTELWLANDFLNKYIVKYCSSWKTFATWREDKGNAKNGTYQKDCMDCLECERVIKNYAAQKTIEIKAIIKSGKSPNENKVLDNDEIKKLCKIIDKLGTSDIISSIKRLIRSDVRVKTLAKDWDSNIWSINCPKGTINLKTGLIEDRNEDILSIKRCAYNPSDSISDNWVKFIMECCCGDLEMADYLQRLCGYLLTGSTKEQQIFFFNGTGGNGKGLFVNVINRILCDYSGTMDSAVVAQSNRFKNIDLQTSLSSVDGKRAVFIDELPDHSTFVMENIKKITGGSAIPARYLYGAIFDMVPQFKLIILSNPKPKIAVVDNGVKRRMRLVPFRNETGGNDNKNLESELMSDAPGIFRWMIIGAKKYIEAGLKPCPSVINATEKYLGNEQPMQIWMDQCAIVSNEWGRDVTSQLFKSWTRFCVENNEKNIGTQREFVKNLQDIYKFTSKHSEIGTIWGGLELKPTERDKNNSMDGSGRYVNKWRDDAKY